MTHAITDAQTSSLVFYSLPNYAGNAMQAVHGQTGIVASSDTSWAEQSVSAPGSDNMFTFLCSGVDTGSPALVACAVQTWTSTFTTASHSFSGKSNNGLLAIIDKT